MLAPEAHRQLGTEDGCEAQQEKTSRVKGKLVPSITQLNRHLAREAGKLLRQEDLAGATAAQANAVGCREVRVCLSSSSAW